MKRQLVRRLSRAHSTTRLHGFTLVELLVVITIIGILMSLLLPAVQSARTAAQENTCLNNIKQIGLGALQHEQHYGWFPTGGWGKSWAGDPNYGFTVNQPGGFFYNILPFIEQENLWSYGVNGQSTSNGQTQTTILQCASMPVQVFNCPGRRPLQTLPIASSGVTFYSASMAGLSSSTMLARCDYAACAGDIDAKGATSASPTQPTSMSQGLQNSYWNPVSAQGVITPLVKPAAYTGVCAPHSQVRTGAITRGLSYLFLAGEKYLDPDHYLNGVDLGDNATWDMGFDPNVVRWVGGGVSTNSSYLPVQDTLGVITINNFGSTHVTGFGMVFCDGSTRRLNYTIDPTTYGYLGNRNLNPTDPPIDDSKF